MPYGTIGATLKLADGRIAVTPNVRLTGAQLRAARALLGMAAAELAAETKIGLRTIRRAEIENGPVPITAANAERLIEALERRGIQFTWDDGVGVKLRLSSPILG